MDPTTRPYARRILLLHLVLLAAVIALVSLASWEVYTRARDQLISQARSRQELLAKQTASALDSYYTSITSDLNFLRRSESSPATTPAEAPEPSLRPSSLNLRPSPSRPPRLLRPLWNQLDGRVSNLLYVHRQTLAIAHAYPEDTDRDEAQRALQPFAAWLRDLDHPGVSPFRPTRAGGANLIAVPLGPDYALAAVVPVSNVEQQFFRVVNRDRSTFATLLDENGLVMVTSDLANPSFSPITPPPPPEPTTAPRPNHHRRVLARMNVADLQDGTAESRGRLTTVEPVSVDGRTFHVVIASPLADVTAPASTMFARALVGGIFVILSVTAILLSTALRLIRARQHIETIRHEMLTKELDQARAIQLHWLPNQSACPPHFRVAATNQTANHISGDFYDWFTLPDGRGVLTIGDVTGHGMSAAFLMATTQLLVRTTLPRTPDPAACLEAVNRQLCSQSFHGQFVTLLLLTYDPRTRTLAAATAGHMPPLHRTLTEGFRPLSLEPQLPLGIDADTAYATERFTLSPDSALLLYTDGLTEAPDPAHARFGLPRLLTALNTTDSPATPHTLLDQVVSAVTRFRGPSPLTDDLTLVVVDFPPAPSAPRSPNKQTEATTTGG